MLPNIGEGEVLDDLEPGALIEVETKRHVYHIEYCGLDKALISGHPLYCPEPVLVDLHSLIGRGMRLQFEHPVFGLVTTSRVQDIRERVPVA